MPHQQTEERMISDLFHVPGISCQHCVNAITKAISALPGVQQVVVNLSDKSVRVDHDQRVAVDDLIRAINDAGYDEVAVLV
jgi:copper ion binding protein